MMEHQMQLSIFVLIINGLQQLYQQVQWVLIYGINSFKFNQQYMKKLFSIIALLSTAIVYGQNNNVTIKAKTFTTGGKKIIVYTTADNTSDKLSVTDTLVFKHMGQPFETQVCVFVDPTKTFQT